MLGEEAYVMMVEEENLIREMVSVMKNIEVKIAT